MAEGAHARALILFRRRLVVNLPREDHNRDAYLYLTTYTLNTFYSTSTNQYQHTCTIYRDGARHPRHLNARMNALLLLK